MKHLAIIGIVIASLAGASTTQAQPALRCPEWAGAIEYFGLPERFDYIIWRESRCDPNAINRRSGSRGLTQIMPMWVKHLAICGVYHRNDLLDPGKNLCGAVAIMNVQGIRAWATR